MGYSKLLTVFNTLSENLVSYLVVGGTAVSYYSHYRPSVDAHGKIVEKPDLDIWYSPTYTNYYKLLKALAELGQDVTRYQDEPIPDPRQSFFRYEFDEYTLDMLPCLCAPLSFSDCFKRRTVVSASGVDILIIGLDDLIRDKQALGRQKDLIDIRNLRKSNPD